MTLLYISNLTNEVRVGLVDGADLLHKLRIYLFGWLGLIVQARTLDIGNLGDSLMFAHYLAHEFGLEGREYCFLMAIIIPYFRYLGGLVFGDLRTTTASHQQEADDILKTAAI